MDLLIQGRNTDRAVGDPFRTEAIYSAHTDSGDRLHCKGHSVLLIQK
jgi:hypothetical protein